MGGGYKSEPLFRFFCSHFRMLLSKRSTEILYYRYSSLKAEWNLVRSNFVLNYVCHLG
jgi:hypothetical protein